MMKGQRAIALVVLVAMGAGIVVGGLGALRGTQASDGLTVSGAMITPPLAGRDIAAGYMTITSDSADALVAVQSDAAQRIEIHRSVADGDRVRMERLDNVALPAGTPVVLAPGGMHLMLFGAPGLRLGQRVHVTLRTASGTQTHAVFVVGRVARRGAGQRAGR